MILGACLALIMLPRQKIVRTDGSRVDIVHSDEKITFKTVFTDALSIFKAGFANPKLLALIPLFYSSNFVYSYQFDAVGTK
jgi:hypothetical protein